MIALPNRFVRGEERESGEQHNDADDGPGALRSRRSRSAGEFACLFLDGEERFGRGISPHRLQHLQHLRGILEPIGRILLQRPADQSNDRGRQLGSQRRDVGWLLVENRVDDGRLDPTAKRQPAGEHLDQSKLWKERLPATR